MHSSRNIRWFGPAGGLAATALASLILAGSLILSSGCRREVAPPPRLVTTPKIEPRQAVPVPVVRFTHVKPTDCDIDFRHTNGSFGKKLLPETMGSGVVVIDYDGDGKPDLLFVNGRPWPGHEKADEALPTLKLYRNLGGFKFQDVTRATGLAVSMFGMGGMAGDFDNDGWTDLFITGVGGNRLFRNVPVDPGDETRGRRFVDVTVTAGVEGAGGWKALEKGNFLEVNKPLCFSTSAAWLDYDGDGKLDLFVCNYVTWSPDYDLKQSFKLVGQGRAFGPPTEFKGTQCFLYRNKGDGTFEDVSDRAGIQVFEKGDSDADSRVQNVGKSLGVIVCDIDDDGWPDIVVANDTVRNFCFHNVAKGRDRGFEEIGQKAGVAYPETGKTRGAMGIDWARDYRPGQCALLIGNFSNEPDTFLRLTNARQMRFSDASRAEGIAGPSRELLKFGVFFFDYDLDGRLDILTCNGHLEPEISKVQQSQRYEQPPQLFWNTGQTTRGFEPVTPEQAGSDFFGTLVGRGCAFADLDGDGDLDVILTANGGVPRLLRNDGKTGHHWIRLKLEGDGKRSNRSAIGARVKLEAGTMVQYQQVVSGRGYLSQSELALTFGLGKTNKVDRITIQWPGRNPGPPTVLTEVKLDTEISLCQKEK